MVCVCVHVYVYVRVCVDVCMGMRFSADQTAFSCSHRSQCEDDQARRDVLRACLQRLLYQHQIGPRQRAFQRVDRLVRFVRKHGRLPKATLRLASSRGSARNMSHVYLETMRDLDCWWNSAAAERLRPSAATTAGDPLGAIAAADPGCISAFCLWLDSLPSVSFMVGQELWRRVDHMVLRMSHLQVSVSFAIGY